MNDHHSGARCRGCARPVRWSTVLSTHRTSAGTVRYLRCACGQLVVQGADGTWGIAPRPVPAATPLARAS